MSSQHQASRTTAAVQTGHPQRSARQPLSVKNSMPNSAIKNNSSSKGEVAGEEAYPIKPIPNSHLAPPARFRRPAAATTISSPPLINTSSTTAPSPNQRIYTSHHPSPLGLKAEELPGSDGGSSSSSSQMAPAPLSPSIIKTPKKRAIPVEDVHVRNTVPGHQVDELDGPSQSPNPNKRSRSSKHGSSATDPSTSTSLSIATGLGDVNLQSQGAASYVPMHHHQDLPPPLPKHHAVQPSHTHAQNHPSRPPVPPPHPRQTTTRIDKQSRMTENDRLQRERQKIEAQKEWRKKFLKAFPLFHFHLDGFDEALRKEITGIIEQLGGTIEPFFSNNVSHLVTTRKLPLGAIPDAQTGPLALVLPSPRGGETSRSTASVGSSKNASHTAASIRPLPGPNRLSRLPALRKKNIGVPLHSDRNPFEECGPALPANDILVKARNFGMKVWTLDKFRTVISNLLGIEVNTDPKKQQNLSQMLEKAPHLTERDTMTARDNFHFFPKNTAYILVEDATGEHRPIMVQEWTKPVTENDAIPWPVLYGQLEGRCPFTKFDFEGDLRKRMKPNRHETLKRSVSLSHLNRGGLAVSPAPSGDSRGSYSINRGASPYPLASGNSVSLTSNIASTTSTAMTGPSGLGLIPPYGAGALGRKVNQASAIGLGRPSSIASNARSSHSSTAPGGGSVAALNEQARGSLVRRMLGITEQTRNNNLSMVRRSVSTASAGHQLRREKKPGYCENCRSKYDDFDEHIAGRKHRKFAEDDGHFAEIDTLLNRVSRPIAAWAMGVTSEPESMAEAEVNSNSSLLAAGGSLLEVEGVEGEEQESSIDRLPHLRSPRGFIDVMHQWQQSTQMVDHPEGGYPASLSSPFSHHSPAAATLDLEADSTGKLDDFGEHESTSSHGGQTTAGNTTATTVDHQTEEDIMISQSPDTSPHTHHQYHHHHDEKQEQDDSYTSSHYGTAI